MLVEVWWWWGWRWWWKGLCDLCRCRCELVRGRGFTRRCVCVWTWLWLCVILIVVEKINEKKIKGDQGISKVEFILNFHFLKFQGAYFFPYIFNGLY